MVDKTGIQWTDATWNPTVGCRLVSPGCTNCYAMREAARIELMGGKAGAKYAGLTAPSKACPVWNGTVRLAEDALGQPLHWSRPRRIFVNSMSDLFADELPDEAIDRVFAVMALAPQHTFQVLTKRAARMRDYFRGEQLIERIECFMWGHIEERVDPLDRRSDDLRAIAFDINGDDWPLQNVWLGVSVEDQATADERVPHLLKTPAAVRFLSCEPLLGPLDLRDVKNTGDAYYDALEACPASEAIDGEPYAAADWVICGGESGSRARPMHPDWARSLRDQCATAGVPFFMKQMTKKRPIPADLMIRGFPRA